MVPPMLKSGLGQKLGGPAMSQISTRSDNRSLYVLITSTLGAMFSMAATWIIVAHQVVHSATPLVAYAPRRSRMWGRLRSLAWNVAQRSPEAGGFCPGQIVRHSGSSRVAGGVKQVMERAPVERLLQEWNIGVAGFDAFHPIASDEYDGHALRRQYVGDRIDQLAAKVDIENRSVEMRVGGCSHGLGKRPVGTDNAKAQLCQGFFNHHSDHRLILDEQDRTAGFEMRKISGVLVGPFCRGPAIAKLEPFAVRKGQRADEPGGVPIEYGLSRELLKARSNDSRAIALRGGRCHARTVRLQPFDRQSVAVDRPAKIDLSLWSGQSAVFGRVRCKLVNRERESLRAARIEDCLRSFNTHHVWIADPVRINLLGDESCEIGALPTAFR